jgi:hypothetical protein
MVTQYVDQNLIAYWAATHIQFQNIYEITESARKISSLNYKGHISKYLMKLGDLTRSVKCTGQIFRNQITDQIPSKILDMRYMIGPIPMQEEQFIPVLDRACNSIEHRSEATPKGILRPTTVTATKSQ